ncbi:hypothetical protein [Mesorhizobium sp. M0040]|uniref:hypothetical protein n=1 Tax=Mesorhizobium sp. M0040 TaxID=2956855 RepID=UPI00333625CA
MISSAFLRLSAITGDTQLRWRRGFFRLWLLVAIVWVGIGVYANFSGRPYFPELRIAVRHNGEIAALKPWSDEAKVLEAGAEGGISERQLMLVYPGGATYYADVGDDVPTQSSKLQKVTSYLESERTRIDSEYRKSCVETFLYLGVFPPLILLVLGAALRWVLLGFRSASQT